MNRRRHLKSSKKNIIAVVILCAVIALVVVGAQLLQRQFARKYRSQDQTVKETEQTQPTEPTSADDVFQPTMELQLEDGIYGSDHEINNYLFMGTDYSGNEQGTGEEYRGTMADFLMLVTVDHTDQSYAYIELNRDTMTEIVLLQTDGSDGASAILQLCTAHWYGGNRKASCKNTVRAVSDLFGGLPIDEYYELNMTGIPAINHALGGVEVTIEDDFSQSDPSLVMGETITLSDEQAYHFLHDRMNVGDGENSSRMRRQQAYISGMFEKMRNMQKEDDQFVIDLLQDLSEYSVSSMDFNQIGGVIQNVQGYHYDGRYSIDGETRLGQALGDGLDHTEFYMDEADKLEKLIQIYHLQKIADDEVCEDEDYADEEEYEDDEDYEDYEDEEEE